MCTFAWPGRVRVVTVTAKQSALQSPLQSHSSVLSAPPPTPRKPRITIICYPPALPGCMSCPDIFRSSFPLPFHPPYQGKQKASRCILPPQQSHTWRYPCISSAFYLFSEFPAPPAPPPAKHFAFLLPPKTRPQPQPPSHTGAGAVTLLSLKASFSSYIKPLTNPSPCSAASPKPTFT